MLDPFSALSLAGTIVQFVDFSSKLVANATQLYRSTEGCLAQNAELSTMVADLSSVISNFQAEEPNHNYSNDERALSRLATGCQDVADKLLKLLDDLSVKNMHSKWNIPRQAWRNLWNASEIRGLQKRLDDFRGELTIRLVAVLRDQQSAMNIALQDLSYSNNRIGLDSNNNLLGLKRDLLLVSEGVQKNRQEFEVLATKILELVRHGQRLAAEQAILESLKFERMRNRCANITERHGKTFDWVFDEGATLSAKTNFSNWLRIRSGIYWITGKAGAGKSTLMKYLSNHKLVTKMLGQWAGSKPLITASYFFWSAGADMEKSQQGLLQTLLFDILSKCPSIIPEMSPDRWASPKLAGANQDGSWSLSELLQALEWLTKRCSWPARFCFFIDGVDEYKGNPAEIVHLLQKFTFSPDVKVILASRNWTEIESQLKPMPGQTLIIHNHTRADIKAYIREILVQNPRFQAGVRKDQRYEQLENDLVDKAQGVFLWVFLAVRELLRGLTHEDTVSDLENRLKEVPPDLEEFFKRILDSIDHVYHPQSSRIFQMCLAATEPLPLLTFSFFEDEGKNPNYAIEAAVSPWDVDETAARCNVVRKRVKARCRDFLEVNPDPGPLDILFSPLNPSQEKNSKARRPILFEVDFLHRTVRDFFLGDAMQARFHSWMDTPFYPHQSLSRSFMNQMKILPPTNKYPEGPHFISLLKSFLHHAREAEISYGFTDFSLIEELDSVGIYHLGIKTQTGDERWTPGWILALSVHAGLSLYTERKVRDEPGFLNGVNTYPSLAFVLLKPIGLNSNVARGADLNMLQVLLKAGANPNQAYLKTTIWLTFLGNCYAEGPGSFAPSGPASSTERGWPEMMALLLEHGADIEIDTSASRLGLKTGTLQVPGCGNASVSQIVENCCPDAAYRLNAIIERKKAAGARLTVKPEKEIVKRGSSIWRWIGWVGWIKQIV